MAHAPLHEHGEPVVDLIESDLAPAAEFPADAQVLEHGERRKQLSPLGHEGDSLRHDLAGREEKEVVAGEARTTFDAPGLGTSALRNDDFPAPLAPMIDTISPSPTVRSTSRTAWKAS